ncbi:hypothetical protein [Photobacterium leiognathi]|uniref:hypothetical protein n=1 Tax=Photobacterium leiognathi TaxID=553611 RepID=UPI00298247C8|nr:hypothetical protein [Photobacterium leiognathi]
MKQGYISSEAWERFSTKEKQSLLVIRDHFEEANYLPDHVNSQKLVDQSFEAMGKVFRDRINNEVSSYGRYVGEYDGVFLIIQGSIRDFDSADQFFPEKFSDAKSIYQDFQRYQKKFDNSTSKSIANLENAISWLREQTFLRYQQEQLDEATIALRNVSDILVSQLAEKASSGRPQSSVEFFVNSVCDSLIWFGGIKPTKPLTDSGQKTPLLRFLEVFYPFEAESALSRLYEKNKRAPASEKVGASFLPVK